MIWRRVLRVLFGTLALASAGCGGPSASPSSSSTTVVNGVVTGVATPCHPQAATSAQLASLPVGVTITSDGKTVGTQTVTGTHTYRFVVPPGTYEVSSSGLGSASPATVTVRPGEVVHADLLSDCI